MGRDARCCVSSAWPQSARGRHGRDESRHANRCLPCGSHSFWGLEAVDGAKFRVEPVAGGGPRAGVRPGEQAEGQVRPLEEKRQRRAVGVPTLRGVVVKAEVRVGGVACVEEVANVAQRD